MPFADGLQSRAEVRSVLVLSADSVDSWTGKRAANMISKALPLHARRGRSVFHPPAARARGPWDFGPSWAASWLLIDAALTSRNGTKAKKKPPPQFPDPAKMEGGIEIRVSPCSTDKLAARKQQNRHIEAASKAEKTWHEYESADAYRKAHLAGSFNKHARTLEIESSHGGHKIRLRCIKPTTRDPKGVWLHFHAGK